jgi:hypothetical protein
MLCFSVKLMVIFRYRNTFSLSLFSNTVRDTFLIRILTIYEKNILHLTLEDKETRYRAKIILLKDEGYTVPEMRKITNHHDNNIRKWIHKFNEKGIDGIMPKKHSHKQYKFDNDMEKKIVDITSSNPRSYGLGFST